MSTRLTREQIAQAVGTDVATILAFEELFRSVVDGTGATTLNAAATKELQDASVLTLSPNDTFTNERVIAAGQGIELIDTGSNLIIATLFNIAMNGGYRLTINLPADLNVSIPFSGTVMIEENPSAVLPEYATNALALSGGLVAGDLFRTTIAGEATVKVVI